MVSNAILIGIIIGVFFVGIGISYAHFQINNPSNFMGMAPQQMMQQMSPMMNDPQLQQQMMGMMMQNPEMMQAMMGNQQMMGMMGQGMMGTNMMMQNWNYDPQTTPSMMMTDPQMRQQMFDQMDIHHQYVLDTMSITIGDEQLKSDFIGLMNEHNRLIGEMYTSYSDDPEIQQRIHDHIAQHHQFLQKLTGQ